MQSVIVIVGGSPCPACGGRYRFRTPDNVTLCISCLFTDYVRALRTHYDRDHPGTDITAQFRGIKVRRTVTGFEIERLDRHAA